MRFKLVFLLYIIILFSVGLILNGGLHLVEPIKTEAKVNQQGDPIYQHNEAVKDTFLESTTNSNDITWTDYHLIAHALGSVDHKRAMNSVEGLAVNYTDFNIRVFETDLILTADDKLVNRHDWMSYLYDELEQSSEKGRKSMPLTYSEFMNLSIHKRYDPMDLNKLVRIMSQHKDIFIITDTKYTDQETISKQFKILVETVMKVDPSILDRLIIQIYNHQMYDAVMSIYPFKNLIYSVYANMDSPDDVINYCKAKKIGVVAIPTEKVTMEYIRDLKNNNIKAIVHTVNSVEGRSVYMAMGANAIFSDYLTE